MFDTDRVVPVMIFLRGTGVAPASLVLGTEPPPLSDVRLPRLRPRGYARRALAGQR